jgi:hypothetical protein
MAAAGLSGGPAGRIGGWLRGIGIPVEAAELPGDTFLPGILLKGGRLRVDEARLAWPGDLLHEAGHVAVAPAEVRERLGGAMELPGVDVAQLEWGAIAWSYAAALDIGIDPAEVFHGGGYRGHSPGLLRTFALGAPIGLHVLEEAGMAAGRRRAAELGVEPYPHMLRWMR